ncbi:MAG: hypothetical protein WBI34_03115 [Tenuifilaceae bacterium]|jgi:hypothetical protein|nr:hypothetical protein [Bacteroidales bacterium]MDI9515742.1 hypothetical protein [Bacteroidota bacterium]NLH56476.1 hypothetical protein [Rikenellaceae bacterium]OQC64118.1 MAG: hypothetical protein BWX49_00873 [Bacteroidetes bacterium ADurb.Bin008]HNV81405.1 hypothetical protein [Tenuifilaceae bacterium]
MKTKVKILTLAVATLLVSGCSTSMHLSRASKHQGDDIYHNPSVSNNEEPAVAVTAEKEANKQGLDLAELEKRYYDILASDSTGKIDTLVYKADDKDNPYDRLLSTSYEDSYRRRQEARLSGYNSYADFYDDLWYASVYDPSFYNVIVYGGHVWVEPNYISSMFLWPYRYNRYGYWGYNPWSFYMGWGFGYGYPYYSYWGYPYYSYWGNPYYYGGYGWYGWNSYMWGYNSGFWDGYYGGFQVNGVSYHYGRRPVSGNTAYEPTGIGTSQGASIGSVTGYLSTKQPTLQASNNNSASGSLSAVSQEPTKKPIGQAVVRQPSNTNPERGQNQPQLREPVRNPDLIKRPSRESLNVNPTRVKPGDGQNRTGSGGTYNPSYTRPQPGNSNEFNRPIRGYPSTEAVRGDGERKPRTSVERGSKPSSSESYASPHRGRTSSPSSSERNNSGSSSYSRPSSSGSSSSSGSGFGSSSGSSSRSSTGSSGGSSSGGTRTRTR